MLVRRTTIAPLLVVLLVIGVIGCTRGPDDPAPIDLRAADTQSVTPSESPDEHEPTRVVRLDRPVVVRSQPSDTSPSVTTLGPTTPLGSSRVLVVVDEHDGWLEVSLPIRPNGSSGWIRSDGLELATTSKRVEVDLERRTLTVSDGSSIIESSTVAVGAPSTPTPRGSFYVTDLVETDSPGGPYGPFALGISAHSDQLTEFAGGEGQVGIHGTNDPASIGRDVSNGCIRLANEVVSRLIDLIELGTPVVIR